MSESEKTVKSAFSPCTIFLLLFIGFIFGVPTGFMAKDTVLRSYLKMFNNANTTQQDSEPLRGREGVTTIEEIVVSEPAEDTKANEQQADKKEEDKKEGEGENKE